MIFLYALKRISAYIIDLTVAFILAGTATGILLKFSMYLPLPEQFSGAFFGYVSMGIAAGIPIIIYGIMSGTLGWTPGKLVLSLRVRNRNGSAPGIGQGILREVVKYVGLSFMFLGALWALYGVITAERTFYDEWIGLDVDDLRPSGLTETQKRWREFHRQ